MDRRLVGALLVMVVLSAAIVLPLITGRRVAGVGSPAVLPDPPKLGTCLLYPLPAEADGFLPDGTSGDLSDYRPADIVPTNPYQSASTAAFGPCNGAVAGEVVDVVQVAGDASARRAAAAQSDVRCRAAVLTYAGLIDVTRTFQDRGGGEANPVRWDPTLNGRHFWVQPDGLHRAAGGTWLACLLTPRQPVLYTGSVAGAFSGGSLPDRFGVCWLQPDVSPSMTAVDCGQPHRSELMSLGTVADTTKVTAADITSSCRQLATLFVGRDDPTAGGALTVAVNPDELADRLRMEPAVDVTCFLTTGADRRLVGSLVGLGDRPVPFER